MQISTSDNFVQRENYNPNNDSPLSSYAQTPDLKKDNIYLKGGNNIGEAI